MDTTERKFASCEARVYLFGAVVYVLITYFVADPLEVLLHVVIAFALFWLGLRCLGVPRAKLEAEHLLLFEQGQLKHRLPLEKIAEIRKGFDSTILQMRDGVKITIAHTNFVTSADASKFRTALAERLPIPATA